MPQYVSHEGIWHPAKEKVGLINKSGKTKEIDGKEVKDGDPYIYEGPDRAALFELFKQKVETLGTSFRNNPEFLTAIRNQGFQSVDDYLESIGYDENKALAEFEEKASVVQKHELPEKVAGVKVLGGGKDFAAQGEDVYGGFGKPKDLPVDIGD